MSLLGQPANDLESRAGCKSGSHRVVLMNVESLGLSSTRCSGTQGIHLSVHLCVFSPPAPHYVPRRELGSG